MNFFDRVNAWLDRSEVSWVTLLTKILPILVPIIPAFQTKYHVVEVLGYDDWMGWAAAVIVEFFGYAAMYKMIQFAFKKAGFWTVAFAVVIYIVYLAIILVFNVIPEIEQGKPQYIIWMNALFSLLSVPAGALTAISAVHTEREEEVRAEKERARAERKEQRERAKAEQGERREQTERAAPLSNRSLRAPLPLSEQGANAHKEHPFGFPSEKENTRQSIIDLVNKVRSTEDRTPSTREVARAVGCAPSYAHTVMKGLKSPEE